MFKGPIMLVMLLAVALGVPYLISKAGPASDRISSLFGSKGEASSESLSINAADPNMAQAPDGPGSLLFPSQTPLEGPPAQRLEEILRFDITKEWVYTRWRRKSAGLADPELFGVRVPLVTGTGAEDLAGSLSYYFEASGQVARIEFRGRTGDLRPLVQLLTSRFHLKAQPPAMPGELLYQVRWNTSVQSELRARPASVVWESSPLNRFQITLTLNRPGSNRFIKRKPPTAEKSKSTS